jgi:hypothetical protein
MSSAAPFTLKFARARHQRQANYVYLDVRPEVVNKYAALDGRTMPGWLPYTVTAEEMLKKLPDIIDFNRTYLGVDPMTQPMPIQPTAHYTMGGIPPTSSAKCWTSNKASCPACMPPEKQPAFRSMAPTAWAPTRCSTWSCSANMPACAPPNTPKAPFSKSLPADPTELPASSSTPCATATAKKT